MNKRAQKKQFQRAANSFGGYRLGNMGTPGNMYILPESVVKQVMANFAPQKQKSTMYSPGAPITPIPEITPKAGPRGWNYPSYINVSGVDRTLGNTAYDIPSFQQLRMLAKMYSGITLCERAVMDMIPRLELDIVPVPGLLEDGEDTRKYQKDIAAYKKWFEKPDKQHDLHSWLRIAWREQTQIDELYIYKKPNRGGGLYALQIVAGDTMKPLLDEQGIMPLPPYPAYQQFPYGAPGGLYTSDQFIHYQESPSSDTPYGFSRVERIIMHVNIALRKQQKDLYRYTEGNIPAGMMEVPEATNWTPDQIDAFEQSWNALLAGNIQQATRIKFTQPGMKYTAFAQPEGQLHLTEFDQWLLNVTTACYGLSMQDLSFTEDIHKSSGDSQQNVTFRRSLYPFTSVYASILTNVLHEDFYDPRFQVVFKGFEEAEDIAAQATAYSTLTGAGILGISDAAKLMKLPEDKDAAHIGRILIGKDGPIFLDDIANDQVREAAIQAKLADYELAANPQQPDQSTPGAGAQQEPDAQGNGAKPPSSGNDQAGEKQVDDAMDEANKSLSTLSRSDPVRGPWGEFGFDAGAAKHNKGPRRSPRERMQTRAQKLATRFGKLEARRLGKHWNAAQRKAAGVLEDLFNQIASLMAKGGQSSTIDHLLDQASEAAHTVFAGKPKGLRTMLGALTKIDQANDAGLFRMAGATEDWQDEEAGEAESEAMFEALAVVLDDLEEADEEPLARLTETLASIEQYLRELRDQQGMPPTSAFISQQGSCQCETCTHQAGQSVQVRHEPSYHAGCDCQAVIPGIAQVERTSPAVEALPVSPGIDMSEKAIAAEYRRWRTRAQEDIKAGRTLRSFVSEIIPEQEQAALRRLLPACTTAEEVRATFECVRTLLSAAPPPLERGAGHNGVMVAFLLAPQVSAELAVPGGEEADDLHLTLAYLGDASALDKAQQRTLIGAIGQFAAGHATLDGRLSGIGRFTAPEGEPEPVYASVDAPRLPAFRQALVETLTEVGLPPDQSHGFQPHLTLAYVPRGEEAPIKDVSPLSLRFDRLCLVIGDERYIFLLTGSSGPTPGERIERRIQELLPRSLVLASGLRADDGRPKAASAPESRIQAEGLLRALFARTRHPSQEEQESAAEQLASLLAHEEAGQDDPLSHAWVLVHAFVRGLALDLDSGGWQETNSDVHAVLADYQQRGVVELEWHTTPGSVCDQCQRNDGQRVKVGQPFATGAKTVFQHPHCDCYVLEILADGSSKVGYGIGGRVNT